MKLLFVTWDGPGPNYHESLFLPILAESRRPGDEVHLLQFTWGAADRSASIRATAERLGMTYTATPVLRRPASPATAVMLVAGAARLVGHVRRHGVDVLMPRSIIPAGMALLALRALPGVRLLFDADGLMADERADFGGWRRDGRPYRALRSIEAASVRRAYAVVTRTVRARELLAERAELNDHGKIIVVPNGKDPGSFRPGTSADRAAVRRELGLSNDAPLIVYAGSLGPQYHPDRMAAFAAAVRARRSDAHLLVLTSATDAAHEEAAAQGLGDSSYTVRQVPPVLVPRHLAAADLGLGFRSATLSQVAVSPIKVGEYLLCGVPVLGSAGIGDLDDQIGPLTGRLLPRLNDAELERAATWFLDEVLVDRDRIREACRQAGSAHFGLPASVERYREAFELVNPSPCVVVR